MIGIIGRYSAVVNELSFVARCAILTAAVLLTALIALPIANLQAGAVGMQAAGTAAAVCLSSALIAIALANFGRGTSAAVGLILAGDAVAMAAPLVTALVLQRFQHAYHGAGFFGWIAVFYLAALVVKTLLVAPLAGADKNRNAGPRRAGPGAEAGA